MARTNPDGRTDALTHAHAPNKIVTTMSRLPASGLDKKKEKEKKRNATICSRLAIEYIFFSPFESRMSL